MTEAKKRITSVQKRMSEINLMRSEFTDESVREELRGTAQVEAYDALRKKGFEPDDARTGAMSIPRLPSSGKWKGLLAHIEEAAEQAKGSLDQYHSGVQFHEHEIRRAQAVIDAAAPPAEKGGAVAVPPAVVTPTSDGGLGVAATPSAERKVSAMATPKQFKVQREFLLDAVRKAAAQAPEAAQGTVTIEVPGDGTFVVENSRAALERFGETAEKRFGKSWTSFVNHYNPKEKKPVIHGPFSEPTEGSRKAPGPTTVVPVSVKPTPGDLAEAAQLAVGDDPHRRQLHVVLHEDGFGISTDGRRLSIVAGAKGLSPAAALEKTGSKFGDWKGVKPPWLHAKDGVITTGKGSYPKVYDVNTKDVLKAINQVQGVLTKKSPSMYLHKGAGGTIGFSGSSPDVGDYFSEGVDENTAALVALNPQFLHDAMTAARLSGNEKARVFIKDDVSPVVVVAGNNYAAVIMPVRLN